jgi:hypothetical protein|tara:strand:- start:1626 stop:1769 length:144 start_codon:yes stop_codon:yes gene_type:complete
MKKKKLTQVQRIGQLEKTISKIYLILMEYNRNVAELKKKIDDNDKAK